MKTQICLGLFCLMEYTKYNSAILNELEELNDALNFNLVNYIEKN